MKYYDIKYLPNADVEGAGHDIIWSCDAEQLFEAGIIREDAEKLNTLNWMIDEDCLACYA